MLTTYLNKLRLFNRDVRLYLVSWSIVGFNHMGIITVLFNLYLLRLGHGPRLVGMVNGAAWIAYSVACLPAGALGRRWSSRSLMVVGMLIITLGTGFVLVSERIPNGWQQVWISIFYSITWIGAALYIVNSMPYLTSATTDQDRSYAYAIRTALNNTSGFIGSLVAGILPGIFVTILNSGWDKPAPYRNSMWVACVLYGAATLVLLGTSRMDRTQVANEAVTAVHQTYDQLKTPYGMIALFSICMLLVTSGSASIQNFFNVYLDTELAVPVIIIGILSALKQLLSILLALLAPLVTARWGEDRTIAIGFFMRSVSLLPIVFIPHWLGAGLGYISAISMMSLTLPVFGVYQQESVPPPWRAAMAGAVNTAMGISGAIMAYGGAYIITIWGYRAQFLLAAGLVAIGALIFWVYSRRTRRTISSAVAAE